MSARSPSSLPASADLAGESLRSLWRGLARADDFALFIAVCNSPADRTRYIELLKESLPGVHFHIVALNAGSCDPLEETIRQTGGKLRGPVMLTGLESAAPSQEDFRPVLQVLNVQRPKWPEKIPRPVVLWIPDYLLGLMGREAPDFLDWRSDTIFFPPLSEPALIAMDSTAWAGGTDGRMAEPDRRERIRELRSRLAAHSSSDDPVAQSACADWMHELGNHYSLLGEMDAAREMYEKALEISERLGRLEGMANQYGNLGLIAQTRGDLDEAEKMLRKSLEIEERLGHLEGMAAACGNLGLIYETRGDLDEAEKMLRKSLEIAERLGHLEGMAADYGNLGLVAQTRGDLDEAEKMHRKALEIDERLGHLEGMAADYGNLGLVAQTRGDLDGAEKMHRKALDINECLGRLEGMANQYGNLGALCQARGDLDEAEKMLRKSLEINERLGRLEGMANQYGNLGLVAQTRGDLDEAEKMHRKSLEINERLGRLEGMAAAYSNLGLIYRTRGDFRQARELWTKARDLHAKIGMPQMVKQMQDWLDGLPKE